MSKFSCSLTRNMTSHSMENLTFHSLLRWKVIILQILATSLIQLLFERLGNTLFELRSERVKEHPQCCGCLGTLKLWRVINSSWRWDSLTREFKATTNVGQIVQYCIFIWRDCVAHDANIHKIHRWTGVVEGFTFFFFFFTFSTSQLSRAVVAHELCDLGKSHRAAGQNRP